MYLGSPSPTDPTRYRIIVSVEGSDAADLVIRAAIDALRDAQTPAILRIERVDPRRNGHQ